MKKFKPTSNKPKNNELDEDPITLIISFIAIIGLLVTNLWLLSKLIKINNIIKLCLTKI